MDIHFSTMQELYTRVTPALQTKVNDSARAGITYIKEEDIWNYLKENKWIKQSNLALYEMVSDILNVDIILIENYLQQKLKVETRSPLLDEVKL